MDLSADADGLGLMSTRDMRLASITEITYEAVYCGLSLRLTATVSDDARVW